MPSGGLSDDEVVCRLLWRLARIHGWSKSIPIDDLVSQTNVPDEKYARQLCEREVVAKDYVGHQPGTGDIWLKVPHNDLAYNLRSCGYSYLRIESTLSHFDGF